MQNTANQGKQSTKKYKCKLANTGKRIKTLKNTCKLFKILKNNMICMYALILILICSNWYVYIYIYVCVSVCDCEWVFVFNSVLFQCSLIALITISNEIFFQLQPVDYLKSFCLTPKNNFPPSSETNTWSLTLTFYLKFDIFYLFNIFRKPYENILQHYIKYSIIYLMILYVCEVIKCIPDDVSRIKYNNPLLLV